MSLCAGFRIKSGWAAVVVLDGARGSPLVRSSAILRMSDPGDPATAQPFHASRGQLEEDQALIQRRRELIGRSTHAAVRQLTEQWTGADTRITAAGLVVGSMGDPTRISNPHIRAHALEGQLFRMVLEEQLETFGVPTTAFLQRDLLPAAVARLHVDEQTLQSELSRIGRGQKPWRADQKLAVVAAWMVLVSRLGDKET